jgi:hypothetical protein
VLTGSHARRVLLAAPSVGGWAVVEWVRLR